MNFATANGGRVVTASVGIPLRGLWQADLTVAIPDQLASPVALTLGNLSLLGAVYRQSAFAGQQMARLVGGYGGWRSTVPAQSYQSPAGIKLSTVLLDVAAACGEQVNVQADSTIGTAYVRELGPASRVLGALVGAAWYVDATGVTQIGARTPVAITSPFTVEAWDATKGLLRIATEDYASWMPGNTFSGPTVPTAQTISFTRFDVGNDGVARLAVLVQP
jgi:hypothetical protein